MGGKEGHISSTPSHASWDDVLHMSIGHSLLFSLNHPCECVVYVLYFLVKRRFIVTQGYAV